MIRIEQVAPSVVWPVRQQVMYPEHDPDFVKIPGDESAIHLALYEDDALVSVISLFEEKGELQFRKFATVVAHQGKGYGSQLLQHVIRYARQQGIKRVWCNARVSALAFYKRLGFVDTEQRFVKHGIDYVVMELLLQQKH